MGACKIGGPCKIGVAAGSLMAAAILAALPLGALTMQECGAAYKEARSAGTLGGMTWQESRKAKCGAAATPRAYRPGAVFPSGIAPKYADEPSGKARRLTCLDQYRANKASNANAGLRWIQKGGGYYSECNRRLK
jgi:hypothetical protein